MSTIDDYATRLGKATATASAFLRDESYVDRISGRPNYKVMTVMSGGADVYLTPSGSFLVETHPSYPLGLFSTPRKQVRTFSAQELVEYAHEVANRQGNTSPSRLKIDSLLEHLVTEIENLPPIAAIQMEVGSSHRLKAFLIPEANH